MNTITMQAVQLRVARADADDGTWDEFVSTAADSTFCHLSGWRAIVEEVLGREYIPLVAVTLDGHWQGVLPLVRVRSRFFGHSLISLPYLNYGGPLGTPAARGVLLDAAMAEAISSRAGALQIRMRPEAVPADTRQTSEARKVMVLLELPPSPEALAASLGSKLRSQIRRAQKEGMEFRHGTDQVDAFYDVFARNMRDLGTPVYPRAFFDAIAARFPAAQFGAVYHGGRPVAAGAGFVWRNEFEMTWASSLRSCNRLAPNMLLYWSFMEAMIRRGVGVFNFGRSTPGTGPHRFKKQWGGVDVPLHWAEWNARGLETGTEPSSFARAASGLWRRLPLGVANRLGPALAPRLPWW